MKIITPEMIFDGLVDFRQRSHGNKGFARNDDGSYVLDDKTGEPVHMGYTWTFVCEDNPRLSVVDHIMHPAHDRTNWEVWCVDGEEMAGVGDACRALLCPPLLTLPEYVVLERIGDFPCNFYRAIDTAAGAVNPTSNFIEGRWSQVLQVIESLRAKGILRYNSDTDNLEIAT
jgi:hypothetical protein